MPNSKKKKRKSPPAKSKVTGDTSVLASSSSTLSKSLESNGANVDAIRQAMAGSEPLNKSIGVTENEDEPESVEAVRLTRDPLSDGDGGSDSSFGKLAKRTQDFRDSPAAFLGCSKTIQATAGSVKEVGQSSKATGGSRASKNQVNKAPPLHLVNHVVPGSGPAVAAAITCGRVCEDGKSEKAMKQSGQTTVAHRTFADAVNRRSGQGDVGFGRTRGQYSVRRSGFMNAGIAGQLSFTAPVSDRLLLKKSESLSIQQAWGWTLLGQFVGPPPAHVQILNIMNTWGVKAHYRIVEGWLEFVFQSGEDQLKVLMGGPYSIYGKLLLVMNVPENFTFNKKDRAVVPLWVRMKGLPKQFWTNDVIGRVASHVGNPRFLDPVTESRTRGSYARALIEINFAKPITRNVILEFEDGDTSECQFLIENEPIFCHGCVTFGHSIESCPFVLQRKKVDVSKENNAKQVHVDCHLHAPTCDAVNPDTTLSHAAATAEADPKLTPPCNTSALQKPTDKLQVRHDDPPLTAAASRGTGHTVPKEMEGDLNTGNIALAELSSSNANPPRSASNNKVLNNKANMNIETIKDLFVSPKAVRHLNVEEMSEDSEDSLDDFSASGHILSSLLEDIGKKGSGGMVETHFEQEVNKSQNRRGKMFDDRPVVFGLKAMSKWPSPSEAARSRVQTRSSTRK